MNDENSKVEYDKSDIDPESLDPLVDWENAPTVKDLKQNYTDASSDRSVNINKIDRWLDNLNQTGTAKIKTAAGRSSAAPKVIRKQAEWRYASLSEPFLSTDDIFNTAPHTAEDKEAAIQNGLVLNYQFNSQINKTKFVDEYVRTAVDEGTVVIRVGWDFEESVENIEEPQYTYMQTQSPEAMQKLAELNQLLMTDPRQYIAQIPEQDQEAHRQSMLNGTPVQAVFDKYETVRKQVTLKNQPTLQIVNYKSVTIDPTCEGEIDNANFVIYEFETSMAELEADGIYHNLDHINAANSSILAAADDSTKEAPSFSFKDKPRKKFIAYEYWGYWDIDGDGSLTPIVATYVGDVMIRLEENPFPDKKLPFVVVHYLPVRKSIYGEPDGELLEENQKVIGAVTRGMIDILGRGANGQVGVRKGALDVVNKRKFIKGLDYEYNGGDPRQSFHMHTFDEIPESAKFMLGMQNADAESLTGVKAFSQGSGITGDALGDTVGGQKNALDATAKREMGILRRLAKGVTDIGRKIISMNAEFLDERMVVRVTNDTFVPIRRDDLAGNIDLRLTISTAEADAAKAEELSFMLQTVGPNTDPKMLYSIMADIARLRKMPELAKKLDEYEPQPDPIAEAKAQLEVELLKEQIITERSKAIENRASAALDYAKAGTEGEKSRNLSSDSDLKDLDFVEQESGTQQERELQKQSQQAAANAELSTVNHLLKQRETRDKSNADNVTTTNGRQSV